MSARMLGSGGTPSSLRASRNSPHCHVTGRLLPLLPGFLDKKGMVILVDTVMVVLTEGLFDLNKLILALMFVLGAAEGCLRGGRCEVSCSLESLELR